MATRASAGKRKSSAPPGVDDCAVCLSALNPTDGRFVGPCGHVFHVQCAEANFVVGNATTCPCCRAPFAHAPGFVAMAAVAAEAAAAAAASAGGAPAHAHRHEEARAPQAPVLPDVAAPPAAAAPFALAPDFCTAAVVLDVPHLAAGGPPAAVTALLTLRFRDDDDAAPMTIASDFVLLADVSGSMAGSKMHSVRDALLKLSGMFNASDRVCLATFNHGAKQLTPLAPLSDAAAAAAFRRAAMGLSADGGTSIGAAMALARRILAARATPDAPAHVLLLTDGQDSSVRDAAMAPGITWTCMGFGDDHDAELMATLAARSRPRGSFSYVERDDMLDETMASYIGDATRVLATDAVLRLSPAPGARVLRVLDGPGVASAPAADGSVSVALGAARVAERLDILVELEVTPPPLGRGAAFDALRVCVAAAPSGGGAEVRTPDLVVSFAPQPVAPDAAALDALAAAQNRQRLALAASTVAVADSRYADSPALPGAVIAAARSMLRGTPAARAHAEEELAALEASVQGKQDAKVSRLAREAAYASSAGRSLMKGASKGGSAKRYEMQVRKSAH